ncbi:MAG: hypothetical protein LBC53_02285 [Spirochaetaceae bacterium]|jgi:hypothetical protein|nr:hypothetical protein [Spirochaetaceae bacterium]
MMRRKSFVGLKELCANGEIMGGGEDKTNYPVNRPPIDKKTRRELRENTARF